MKDSSDEEKCPYECVDGVITTEYRAYQREGDIVDSQIETEPCPIHGDEFDTAQNNSKHTGTPSSPK